MEDLFAIFHELSRMYSSSFARLADQPKSNTYLWGPEFYFKALLLKAEKDEGVAWFALC
jgi:hypothetical protein